MGGLRREDRWIRFWIGDGSRGLWSVFDLLIQEKLLLTILHLLVGLWSGVQCLLVRRGRGNTGSISGCGLLLCVESNSASRSSYDSGNETGWTFVTMCFWKFWWFDVLLFSEAIFCCHIDLTLESQKGRVHTSSNWLNDKQMGSKGSSKIYLVSSRLLLRLLFLPDREQLGLFGKIPATPQYCSEYLILHCRTNLLTSLYIPLVSRVRTRIKTMYVLLSISCSIPCIRLVL